MGLVVGTPTTRIDALEKTLGRGQFAADMHLQASSMASYG
jgi:CO/xanthine dehydrogenase Mo-binding subunit